MAFTTATLTGHYEKIDGTPASGTVKIIPNSRYLVDAEGDTILAGSLEVTLDATGDFSVVLPATDDATVEPALNRQYTVSARLRNQHMPAVTGITLPGGTTRDMADVTSAAAVTATLSAWLTEEEFNALASRVEDLEAGGGGVPSYNDLTDVPATFPPSAHGHAYSDLTGKPSIPDSPDDIGAEVAGAAEVAQAFAIQRANHAGQQASSTISDLTEAVQDIVGATLAGSTGATVSYNDAAGTITITGLGDPETMRDTLGAALVGVGVISVTVNDGADTITISSTATQNSTDAALRDRSTHTGTQAASTITGLAAVATSGAKADVGLGNVTNTSDANKPVSIAQAAAIAAVAAALTFNVKDYGATGDGTTDDTAAINAAHTAAAAVMGEVFFPAGTYVMTPVSSTSAALTMASGVTLRGAGRRASILKKSGNGLLIDMSGASSASHLTYAAVTNLGINGNGKTGSVFRTYYADDLLWRDVRVISNLDVVLDAVELWDSRLEDVVIELCGGSTAGTTPNVWLRNSSAASGFGFSTDNTNQVHFVGCRFENFTNGAVRIEEGTSNSNNPNGIYFTNCKMETSNIISSSHLYTTTACKHIVVKGMYCFAGAFSGGATTPISVIRWVPGPASVLSDVLISNGATASVAQGVTFYTDATSSLRNVVGVYTTAPTVAHVTHTGGSGVGYFSNVYGSTGTQTSGTPPTGGILDAAIPVNPFGFNFTVDPGMIRGTTDSLGVAAANGGVYIRVRDTATISKVGLYVATSSGNISVAAYSNTGVGRAAQPGTRLATSGAVACPAGGYAEISLGGTVTMQPGDWLFISADNTTAKFTSLLAAVNNNNLGLGREYVQSTAHPAPTTPSALTATTGYTIVLIGIP